jgi:recombination protein RecT
MSNPNPNLPSKAAPTVLACIGSDTWAAEVKKVLPPYLTAELMLRVGRTAALDPRFARCSPQSFLNALLKCARAGLVPDGRNAHLIPFGTECQVIFDWKGLVANASRNGVEVTAKIVCEEDLFKVMEDDGTGKTTVLHEVDYTKARGPAIIVYSRARLKSGAVDYEIMTVDECELIKENFSKKSSNGNYSMMWEKTPTEAYRKTVIRRHSKRWDIDPEERAALAQDDDTEVPVEVHSTVRPEPSKPLFPPRTNPRLGDAAEKLPDEPPEATTEVIEAPTPEIAPEAPESATKSEWIPAGGPEDDSPREDAHLFGKLPPGHVFSKEPSPQPTQQAGKFLKAVRGLCRAGKFPEGNLIDLLQTIGQTDLGSLEEMALTNPATLEWVYSHWTKDLLPKLKELKEGAQ